MLGHGRRLAFLFFFSLLSSYHHRSWANDSLPPHNDIVAILEAGKKENWNKIRDLTRSKTDPFLKLVHLRALYELNHFNLVLKEPPVEHSLFSSYDTYLRLLAAYESKNWNQLIQFSPPSDLPPAFQERALLLLGDAYLE